MPPPKLNSSSRPQTKPTMLRWLPAALVFVSIFILFLRPSPAAGDDSVDALLEQMTLEQKIAQMFMVTLHGGVLNQPSQEFLRQWQPGAVSLFSDNVTSPEGVTALTNAMQAAMQDVGAPPLIIATDQEGGVVSRLTPEAGFTLMPTPLLMGAAGRNAAQQMAIAVAEELRAVGVNMNLAPVADLETNPDNPIIFRRAFGSDPEMVGEAISGYISGMQIMNIMATAKHFPGHGETSADSHAELPRLDLDRERIDSVELVPFRDAIRAGVAAVMVGHLWYTALDPTANMPASLSAPVVTGLLRNELGFNGIIMTDAMDMNAVDLTYNFYDAVLMAIEAGVDMLALGPSTGPDVAIQAIQTVATAVREGRIPESRIDDSVRRILEAKRMYGLTNWQPLDVETTATRMRSENHAQAVANLFRAGVTVASDHFDLVPVDTSQRVAIIFLATRYQIRDACLPYTDPELTQWVGISDAPGQDEINWAVSAARNADTAIVFTQNAISNPAQQALVNALPQNKTVAVALWSPYDWQTYPNVSSYLATYSPARPAVPAVCDILFGAAPAQGRLAVNLGEGLPAGSYAP